MVFTVVSESHTRTAVNGSVLLHFVVNFSDDNEEQNISSGCPALLRDVQRRTDLVLAEYNGIDTQLVTIILSPETPLRDRSFFKLSAEYADTTS